MKILPMLALFTLSNISLAATWVESKVDDPFQKGETCTVSEPGNSTSDIFHQHSKYDQVFWPYTDAHSIWYCEKSGYVSFMSDFHQLKPSEKKNIQTYLQGFKLKEPSEKELLQSLEDIYEMRELSSEHRNMLSRVFARWHQKMGEAKVAARYRKEALTEIENSLLNPLKPDKKLEYLYIAANYSRFFNQLKKSEKYLADLKREVAAITDPKLEAYANYLGKLAEETQYIIPGKAIEPALPN